MAFAIHVAVGGPVPIYRQIVDQVRLAAATGALGPGDELPSVRALAERLVINPNTVARAYAELASEGTIEGHPGRGMVVARRRQPFTKAERLRRIEAALDAFARQAAGLGFDADEIRQLLDQKLRELKLDPESRGEKRHD
jgi:GntR family transcriptional regulator